MGTSLFKSFLKTVYLQIEKLTRLIPDKLYLEIAYRIRTGKRLNLTDPKTFNEKLQWLKLYDRKPIYTKMVDKYEAKRYVAGIIGEEYIIPTLGVWDHFDEIDFDNLPDQFVLKCTHDSGGIIIVNDKHTLDKKAAKKTMEKALSRNFYWKGREWAYKDVKPRLIAEELLVDNTLTKKGNSLTDYKFYCFAGIPKYCQVIRNRDINETIDIFDMNWKLQEFTGMNLPGREYPHSKDDINEPESFDQMKKSAAILSKNTRFLRVDFYEVQGKMYFGELTFFPFSGFGVFEPDSWNYTFGSWI